MALNILLKMKLCIWSYIYENVMILPIFINFDYKLCYSEPICILQLLITNVFCFIIALVIYMDSTYCFKILNCYAISFFWMFCIFPFRAFVGLILYNWFPWEQGPIEYIISLITIVTNVAIAHVLNSQKTLHIWASYIYIEREREREMCELLAVDCTYRWLSVRLQ